MTTIKTDLSDSSDSYGPNPHDFPVTFGDGKGHVIDWSGVTCVVVCLACGHQEGAFFTVADGRAAATKHRTDRHTEHIVTEGKGAQGPTVRKRNTFPADAVQASKHTLCQDCGKKPARRRGLCNTCADIRLLAWLQENGHADQDETITSYRKRTAGVYTTGRWAGHTLGTPVPRKPPRERCTEEECVSFAAEDGLCLSHSKKRRHMTEWVALVAEVNEFRGNPANSYGHECFISGCTHHARLKGLCQQHYAKHRTALIKLGDQSND